MVAVSNILSIKIKTMLSDLFENMGWSVKGIERYDLKGKI